MHMAIQSKGAKDMPVLADRVTSDGLLPIYIIGSHRGSEQENLKLI